LLRIDCGEFQLEHEVARLIGAPPGYLGHRETQPLITQKRLAAVTSEQSNLSIVLFDEIEKAAPSLNRLLLGILDKGVLHLGDNTAVNFESSLVFLTSNLGARGMMRELRPDFGYQAGAPSDDPGLGRKLERIGLSALRRRFSPEFVNRIDAVLTYQPLGRKSLERILDQQLAEFRQLIQERLAERAFSIEIGKEALRFLLDQGTSPEYGARELKRTVHRHVIQPVASRVARGEIEPESVVRLSLDAAHCRLKVSARVPAASRMLVSA
jgi:ATP-dependent Clp protease ATP-binding subunit ClpA